MIRVRHSETNFAEWASSVPTRLKIKGSRIGHLTLRRAEGGERVLEALLLDAAEGTVEVVSAQVPKEATEFPSITGAVPAVHWAERLIGDFWGLRATGHVPWKSLVLNEAWPKDEFPFALTADGALTPRESHFLTVGGEGVHEIPVGPIHAGIIEPGHFRFSCVGEVIANLEIRLGYQHRGIEKRLVDCPWQHARFVAESVSSDSAIANALAHSEALENLWVLKAPPRASAMRTLALEIERIANHLGDLGGLAGDIGFSLGAAAFARLRGAALGLGLILAGSRFQRGFVCPGGVAWDISDVRLKELDTATSALRPAIMEAADLFFRNPGVMERLQSVGVVTPSLAAEFGLVGPAARAGGSLYDARRHFAHADYPVREIIMKTQSTGDAYARAQVRRDEISASMDVLEEVIKTLSPGPIRFELPETLPASGVGVGIVEAWRGELIHWITTDHQGAIGRYVIRDPSFQNWTGLSIAARRNVVADFPLINKSFSLSYSGNDL